MASVAGESMSELELGGIADLSVGGKTRRCRYCNVWSNEPSPWALEGTPLSNWAPNIPWGRGKRDAPIGSICKPCLIAIWMQYF